MRNWILDFEGFAIVPGETKEQAEETFLTNVVPADCPILTANHVVKQIQWFEPLAVQLSFFDEGYGLE